MPWRIGGTAPAVGKVAALAADSELWAHGYASQTRRVAGRYGLWFVVRTRRRRPGPEDQPLEPRVVVDDVELAGLGVDEAGLGVHELEVLGVSDAVDDLAVAHRPRRDAAELGGGLGVAAGVERDAMAAPDELLGHEADDELRAAVGRRRDALERGGELGDTQSEYPLWGSDCMGRVISPPCYAPPR